MNYQRVYDQFIADRRGKEAELLASGLYREIHHVTPRSLGGGEEPQNLLALTPEDHFFAHLVLAQIHSGTAWFALRVMYAAALQRKSEKSSLRLGLDKYGFRRRYGLGRRLADKYLQGESHPNADLSEYRFKHSETGEEFIGTRIAFANATSIDRFQLNTMISDKQRSVHGWYLPDRHAQEEIGLPTGERHHSFDSTFYRFKHVETGAEFRGTRQAFIHAHGVPESSINGLMRGASLLAHGWYLPERNELKEVVQKYGADNPTADTTIRQWRNADTGEEFTGHRWALIVHDPRVSSASVNAYLSGGSKSTRGWYLPERNSAEEVGRATGERNAKYNPVAFYWINADTSEERYATLWEMHRKFGGSRPSWTQAAELEDASHPTVKGWHRKERVLRIRSNKGKKFTFVNRDGRRFTGTQIEFCEMAGLSPATGSRVVRNQSISRNGWRLKGVIDRPHNRPKITSSD